MDGVEEKEMTDVLICLVVCLVVDVIFLRWRRERRVEDDSQFIQGEAVHETLDERLSRVASLGHDWDGYGARPIRAEVLDEVRWFLESVPPGLLEPPPFVVPTAGGTVQLEWHGPGERLLELEFCGNGRHGWLKWCPPEGVSDEGELDAGGLAEVPDMVRWAKGES